MFQLDKDFKDMFVKEPTTKNDSLTEIYGRVAFGEMLTSSEAKFILKNRA